MRTVTALKDLSEPDDDTPPIPNALHGHAVVEQVTRTGLTREGNPEVELVLTVDVADRERYQATVRQVLSRQVLHNQGLDRAARGRRPRSLRARRARVPRPAPSARRSRPSRRRGAAH
ncbi:MAG: hypothetical protein ABW228_01330 [Thermoleophilaceae bacterium]